MAKKNFPNDWHEMLTKEIESLISEGETIGGLAEKIGISQTTLYNVIRNGNQPSLGLAQKIGQHLGFEFRKPTRRKKVKG